MKPTSPNLPSFLRDPLDFDTGNMVLQESVLAALDNMQKPEYGDHRLELGDFSLPEKRTFTKKEQKDAILQRGELSLPVKGTITLYDKVTNKPVASKRTTIVRIPWLSPRGTYIRPGGEYTLALQKRLRPGVYTRKTNTGEYESFTKTKGGTGFNFIMDPHSGELSFKMYNSKTPAYAVMRGLGMSDEEIKETLGDDLYKANQVDKYEKYIPKLWQKVTRGRKETDNPVRDLPQEFLNMELDEETTTKTLGKPHKNVTKDVIRSAVSNLLQTYRGERDVDNRDSYAFQQVLGPEDYFSEGILRDKFGVLRSILHKAQTTKNLDHVHANLMRPVSDFVFNTSRLALSPESANPMDAIDGNVKITGMGDGGFTSSQSVPDSSRLIIDAQVGTIDAVRSPESSAVGIDSRLAVNTYKGMDGKLYSQFNDMSGNPQYLPSSDIDSYVVAFPGEMERAKGGKQKSVRAINKGKLDYVDPSEVNFTVPSGQEMFSLEANLVPYLSGVKGMRANMGCLHPDTRITIKRESGVYFRGPIEKYEWSVGDMIQSASSSGVVTWQQVQAKVPNYNKSSLREVTLKSGRKLTTTDNHKWVTMGEDGLLKEVSAYELSVGTPIPRLVSEQEATINEILIGDTTVALGEDLGWMIGMYLAEGYIRGPQVEFSAIVPGIRDELIRIAPRLFNNERVRIPTNTNYPDGYACVFTNKEVSDWLESEFCSGSYNKKLPGWALGSSVSFRMGLVSGYLCGDGCASLRRNCVRVGATSVSRPLVEDMVELLNGLGIDTTTTVFTMSYSGNPAYKFEIRPQHICRLPRLRHAEKDYRISAYSQWSGKRCISWVPMYPKLKTALSKASNRSERTFRANIYCDRQTKEAVLSHGVENHWCSSGVCWDSVSRVVELPGVPVTYDLDINDQTFLANGVFVHNSKYSVTGDTMVLVKRADDSVYTGPIAEYLYQPGDMTISLSNIDRKVKWLPIHKVSSHDNTCRMYEVTTQSGRTVKATEHHSFVRVSQDCKNPIEEVYTEDLAVGDLLPSAPLFDLPDTRDVRYIRLPGNGVEPLDESVAFCVGAIFSAFRTSNLYELFTNLSPANDKARLVRTFALSRGFPVSKINTTRKSDREALYSFICVSVLPEVIHSCRQVREAFVQGMLLRSSSRLLSNKPVFFQYNDRPTTELVATLFGSLGVFATLYDNALSIPGRVVAGAKHGVPVITNSRKMITLRPWLSRKWRKAGLLFDPIVSIKEISTLDYPIVYDLHMDDNLFWCSAGILVHNTNQAVSMPAREAPSVQTLSSDGKTSFHRIAGEKAGAVYAEKPGTVLSLSKDEMTVRYDDGEKKTIELYNDFPLNRKSQISHEPLVKPGDTFGEDQPLLDSNYTRNGVLALGTHLRAAYMGFGGKTHEDGIVISEDAAKRLGSNHMYTEKLDMDSNTSTDLGQFMSIFGGAYRQDQLSNIDDSGVVLPGTVLKKDDPIIINMQRRTNKGLGMIGGGKGNQWKDSTITWGKEYDGTVTDVWRDKSGMKVAIKAVAPVEVGDKLCFTPDHDIYTMTRGWIPVTEVTNKDICMTLNLDTLKVSESGVSAVNGYACDENIVCINHPEVTTRITMKHKLPVAFDGSHFELCDAATLLALDDFWMLAGPSMIPVFIEVSEHVSVEPYEGWVFCPTLEKDHTLLVKNGTTIHWSGNSGAFGNKGLISSIEASADMPKDSEGRPFDILVNPYGTIGRHNPSQVIEALLGKVAAKTGKPYVLPAFTEENIMDVVQRELDSNGLSAAETVILPEGRKLDNVLTGNGYYLKLHHLAESKASGVGETGYTMAGVPTAEDDGDKPKRIGTLEMDALIAHGVPNVIKDVKLIRGQENRDYFKDIMDGKTPPMPEVSPMYRKFIATLQASGIKVNPVNEGKSLQLAAMTNKDVDALSSGEIKYGDTVKWKSTFNRDLRGDADLTPVSEGLFDRGITGGMGGNRFSHITMPAKLPQPVYEKSIRNLLGVTEKQLYNIIAGKEEIPGHGTGPQALETALGAIDVNKALDALMGRYKVSDRPSVKDNLAKQIKALTGLKKMGLKPNDLLVSKVLVIPPVFRPISINPDFEIISDVNMLYKDLLDSGDNYYQIRGVAGQEMAGEALVTVYNAYKAVAGLGDPVKKERIDKNVHGLLKDVFGPGGNKTGIVQRNLIGTPTSYSARGVIVPDANLTMDEIGIPEDQAWDMFKPFVIRRMIQGTSGTPEEKKNVLKDFEKRRGNSRAALLKEMSERPVIYSRAPVLHKYGIIAGYATPVPGKAIRVNIPVMPGMTADIDGDTFQVHALITKAAVDDAKRKMLPSRHLFSTGDFKLMHQPGHEFNMGLYLLSGKGRKGVKPGRMITDRTFGSPEAVMEAYKRGELELSDDVVLNTAER